MYSEYRKALVGLCDRDDRHILSPWEQADEADDTTITCRRCRNLLKHGTHRWNAVYGRWVPR